MVECDLPKVEIAGSSPVSRSVVTKGMFWKKFYFVVILLSCNCFLLCSNGFCEGVKKFFGCGVQQGNEKKDNFVDNSHVVGLNNNKHEDYNNYINNNNNDLNNEDDNNSDNKVENSNDDNNSDNEGGNSEDNNFGDNSNLNFAFFSNTPCVGKTSILHCLYGMKFDCNYRETIISRFIRVTHKNASNNMIKEIFLWDTPGKKEYRPLSTFAPKDAHVIVFVYDVTEVESYIDLGAYIDQIVEKTPKGCLFFLLGNKLDEATKYAIKKDDGEQLAWKKGITFLGECSDKDNTYKPAQELFYKQKDLLTDGECKDGLSGILNDIIYRIYMYQNNN